MGIVIERLVRCCLAAAGVGLFALAPSVGAAPVPEPSSDRVTAQPGLLDVPVGCAVPDPADVAFIGTAVAKDFEKVRYEIVQLRAGSISGYSIDGLVDVLYLDDAKFVDLDENYLVGARFDPDFGALFSTIRPDEPLFGGIPMSNVRLSTTLCARCTLTAPVSIRVSSARSSTTNGRCSPRSACQRPSYLLC